MMKMDDGKQFSQWLPGILPSERNQFNTAGARVSCAAAFTAHEQDQHGFIGGGGGEAGADGDNSCQSGGGFPEEGCEAIAS